MARFIGSVCSSPLVILIHFVLCVLSLTSLSILWREQVKVTRCASSCQTFYSLFCVFRYFKSSCENCYLCFVFLDISSLQARVLSLFCVFFIIKVFMPEFYLCFVFLDIPSLHARVFLFVLCF